MFQKLVQYITFYTSSSFHMVQVVKSFHLPSMSALVEIHLEHNTTRNSRPLLLSFFLRRGDFRLIWVNATSKVAIVMDEEGFSFLENTRGPEARIQPIKRHGQGYYNSFFFVECCLFGVTVAKREEIGVVV